MSEPRRPISSELRPYLDRVDEASVDAVGDRLHEQRPVPRAGFRAEMRARIGERERRRGAFAAGRPRRLRLTVACYLGSGLALMSLAAVGVVGAGPLS